MSANHAMLGPRTTSELVISIDIADFPSHDRLASYCGLAPRNRRSGTSISSVSASRQGNKRLEPARVLVQLPGAQPQPMGRPLRALPRQGDTARQGPEGRGEEAAQDDLRGHERQGSVRNLTACVSAVETPIERTSPS